MVCVRLRPGRNIACIFHCMESWCLTTLGFSIYIYSLWSSPLPISLYFNVPLQTFSAILSSGGEKWNFPPQLLPGLLCKSHLSSVVTFYHSTKSNITNEWPKLIGKTWLQKKACRNSNTINPKEKHIGFHSLYTQFFLLFIISAILFS